jgi:hypothetical protein
MVALREAMTLPTPTLVPPSREVMRAWIEERAPCPWPDAPGTDTWVPAARETYCSFRLMGLSHEECLFDPGELDAPGIEATDEVLEALASGRMPAEWQR